MIKSGHLFEAGVITLEVFSFAWMKLYNPSEYGRLSQDSNFHANEELLLNTVQSIDTSVDFLVTKSDYIQFKEKFVSAIEDERGLSKSISPLWYDTLLFTCINSYHKIADNLSYKRGETSFHKNIPLSVTVSQSRENARNLTQILNAVSKSRKWNPINSINFNILGLEYVFEEPILNNWILSVLREKLSTLDFPLSLGDDVALLAYLMNTDAGINKLTFPKENDLDIVDVKRTELRAFCYRINLLLSQLTNRDPLKFNSEQCRFYGKMLTAFNLIEYHTHDRKKHADRIGKLLK